MPDIYSAFDVRERARRKQKERKTGDEYSRIDSPISTKWARCFRSLRSVSPLATMRCNFFSEAFILEAIGHKVSERFKKREFFVFVRLIRLPPVYAPSLPAVRWLPTLPGAFPTSVTALTTRFKPSFRPALFLCKHCSRECTLINHNTEPCLSEPSRKLHMTLIFEDITRTVYFLEVEVTHISHWYTPSYSLHSISFSIGSFQADSAVVSCFQDCHSASSSRGTVSIRNAVALLFVTLDVRKRGILQCWCCL